LQPHVNFGVTSDSKRPWIWETERPAQISESGAHIFPQSLKDVVNACKKNSKVARDVEPEYFI